MLAEFFLCNLSIAELYFEVLDFPFRRVFGLVLVHEPATTHFDFGHKLSSGGSDRFPFTQYRLARGAVFKNVARIGVGEVRDVTEQPRCIDPTAPSVFVSRRFQFGLNCNLLQ